MDFPPGGLIKGVLGPSDDVGYQSEWVYNTARLYGVITARTYVCEPRLVAGHLSITRAQLLPFHLPLGTRSRQVGHHLAPAINSLGVRTGTACSFSSI